jgi:hypothetical protein
MRNNRIIMVLAGMGLALATHANANITFNFQPPEVPAGGDLGANPVGFVEGGVTLTANGFGPSGAVDLYSKNAGVGEIGLGLANDPSGENEITPGSFVQLTVPTSPPYGASLVIGQSITSGSEIMHVYFGTTSGTLGATSLGTITASGGSLTLSPTQFGPGFIDITSDAGNVLLASVTFVPEPSTLIAGALLLLPFGASTLRTLQNRKQ